MLGAQTIAFVFEVSRWTGELRAADPDGLVRRACWLEVDEALELLEALPWRAMRQPLVAYLRGEGAASSVWLNAMT